MPSVDEVREGIRDGTHELTFDPLSVIARLIALIPPQLRSSSTAIFRSFFVTSRRRLRRRQLQHFVAFSDMSPSAGSALTHTAHDLGCVYANKNPNGAHVIAVTAVGSRTGDSGVAWAAQ
jgi:hypothetical protein